MVVVHIYPLEIDNGQKKGKKIWIPITKLFAAKLD